MGYLNEQTDHLMVVSNRLRPKTYFTLAKPERGSQPAYLEVIEYMFSSGHPVAGDDKDDFNLLGG